MKGKNNMKTRKKVYVQVRNKTNGHWSNYKAGNTYDDALSEMKKLQQKYPNATFRILDNNLITHTN